MPATKGVVNLESAKLRDALAFVKTTLDSFSRDAKGVEILT